MHRAIPSAVDVDKDLVHALMSPGAFDHAVQNIELMETHISWLILAGDYVYKIKKPLTLDFLDFGNLEKRRFFCNEEIRLNKPWAPDIYIDVVPITLDDGLPHFSGNGKTVEYAVRMNRFDQQLRLDMQLAQGDLSVSDMRELATSIAWRHTQAPVVAGSERERVVRQTRTFIWENFAPLDGVIADHQLAELYDWTDRELDEVDELLWRRFDDGFMRDCHGDLHLGNLVRLANGITTFDCIEFNADLRNIDVFCDIGFLVMDLVARERHDLAAHFLNRYLECTGDYEGVALLDLYFVYRCLVRAKVSAILSRERDSDNASDNDITEAQQYVDLARRQISKSPPIMIILSGLSGSGKTWVSGQLMAALPAIRIRSDIERKRMFGLHEAEDSDSAVGAGIYTEQSSRTVYSYLIEKAKKLLAANHNVILDAAFLDHNERRAAIEAAEECGCAVILLQIVAPLDILKKRIRSRQTKGSNASEAGRDVLQHQIATANPLTSNEKEIAVVIDNSTENDIEAILKSIKERAGRRT
jgi:aminoglycoside phosphotransferase family enzyme/predicted kinase